MDVQKIQAIAFAVVNGGSSRITQSQVLPNLALNRDSSSEIALQEEALQRSRTNDLTQVGAWLLTQIQTLFRSAIALLEDAL